LRDAWGVSGDTTVFLFMAKLERQKAPEDVLEAYALLPDVPKKALVMAGEGALRNTLERRVSELGLKGVCFPGFVNQAELPNYYAAADVLVRPDGAHPYKGDWGLSVNEGMAAGLAIISTREIGVTDDLVIDGENGLVFAAGNIKELAARMHRLLLSHGELARMKLKSRERIANWSYEQCVEGILAALDAMVPSKRAQGFPPRVLIRQ
jgi:glycosyltransferase involved in cell wall biosynthesis